MQPAIEIAETGFIILPGEIYRQQSEKEKLNLFEGSKLYFLDSVGESFKIGHKLVQNDLAYILKKYLKKVKKVFTKVK